MKYKLLALLIFLSTIASVPQAPVFAVIFCFGIYNFLNELRKNLSRDYNFLLLIIFTLSIIIFYYGLFFDLKVEGSFVDYIRSSGDLFPYFSILVVTIFFAKKIDIRILWYLNSLILVEVVLGIIQYIIGVPYFINPHISVGETDFGSSDLLYYNRVYGLSSNSSIFGQKIVVACVISYLFKERFKDWKKWILLFLLMGGIIVTFNRTVIVSLLFVCFLLVVRNFIHFNIKKKLYLSLVLFIGMIVVLVNLDFIKTQFFRGKGGLEVTGRDMIFEHYYNLIKQNLFFGNFGNKLFIKLGDHSFHAHNSFIETIASVGVFLACLLFIYICSVVKKEKIILIIPFIIYSLSQFGLFWGVSFFDIVFFSIIFMKIDNEYISKKV